MAKKPGRIDVHPTSAPQRVFTIEVHNEDADFWGGYSLISPAAGYQKFGKTTYTLVEDHRQDLEDVSAEVDC